MATGGERSDGDLVFGRYRLDEQVAAGGMGVLWRATDTMLDGVVALKRVSLARLDEDDARVTRERALREARLAARLRDQPNIVPLYDVHVSDGDVWLVMEYLPSRSLREAVRSNGPLSASQVARIGTDLATALEAAHGRGVLHRDVTPGNVLIGEDGRIKLTDFGIALATTDDRLTQSGTIIGTLPYLAPEIAREGEPTAASDVFALGATLYFALEGRSPYEQDDNPIRMLGVVANGVVRPAENAGPLWTLLSALLANDPADRPSAAEARTALHRAAAGQAAGTGLVDWPTGPGPKDDPAPPPDSNRSARRPVGARRRRAMAGTAILVVIALVIVLVALNQPEDTDKPALQAAGPARLTSNLQMPQPPSSVDTCALLKLVVAELFNVRNVRRGTFLSGCSADLQLPGGALVKVGYNASPANRGNGLLPTRRYARGVNGLLAPPIREGGKILQCSGAVLLADNSGFYGLATAVNQPAFSIDLCDIMSRMTDAAARLLVDHGVPTGHWADGYRLTDEDSCTAVRHDAKKLFSTLRDKPTVPKFGNWTCGIGITTNEHALPSVQVVFNLIITRDLVNDPQINTVPVGGTISYQEPDPDHGCRVYVPTTYGTDPAGLSQFVSVLVRANESQEQRCDQARRLAGAVYRTLPH